MTAEFKPGDRVRDEGGYFGTVETVTPEWVFVIWDEDSYCGRHLPGELRSAASPNEKLKEIYRRGKEVSAAPASEPEMREQIARALCRQQIISNMRHEPPGKPYPQASEDSAWETWTWQADVLMPIIARHLAERDAELERTFPRGGGTGTYFRRLPDKSWIMLNSSDQWVTVPPFSADAESRARAAEAALAEAVAALEGYRREMLDAQPCDAEAQAKAVLRSRTITAEGADTGSAAE